MTTKAEQFADKFENDGRRYETRGGENFYAVAEEMGASRHRGADGSRLVFPDDSVIVAQGSGWDLQHAECTCGWCWAGAETTCPEDEEGAETLCPEDEEFWWGAETLCPTASGEEE
jgi:hypothetical protein